MNPNKTTEKALHELLDRYAEILGQMKKENFSLGEDRYSGVFLPIAFDDYWSADFKVMHIGRETAGWNTNNSRNTLGRIFAANQMGNIRQLVDEAVKRYRDHLPFEPDGKLKTTSRSRFKQYYFRIAKELGLAPTSLIYGNLFAWDYDRKSPLRRPQTELNAVSDISLKLLATQIKFFEPDAIVFSTGRDGIDGYIKQLFIDHFDRYETTNLNPGKMWEFQARKMTCFRIAHPRAQRGHQQYRAEVIQRLKAIRAGRS